MCYVAVFFFNSQCYKKSQKLHKVVCCSHVHVCQHRIVRVVGLGLGFGLENKEISKEDLRHYYAIDGKLGHHSCVGEHAYMNYRL